MLRVVVSERGQAELPGIDLDGAIVIGSAPGANVRLPAASARDVHVRIEHGRWRALGDAVVDGTPRPPGASGPVPPDGLVLEIGAYRVRVARAPTGAQTSTPARTESLARELMRGILGDAAAPALEIVRGPNTGARRVLPPPEATLVIGRGDDADWVIHDQDLSRRHAEIARTWDGTQLRDLDSQNGTHVDGKRVATARLHDGMRIAIGSLELVYEDLAERHLRASAKASALPDAPAAAHRARDVVPRRRSAMPVVVAAVIALGAVAALAYVLAT